MLEIESNLSVFHPVYRLYTAEVGYIAAGYLSSYYVSIIQIIQIVIELESIFILVLVARLCVM